MQVLVIGAHGKIGRILTEKLVGDGIVVRAMVRNQAQMPTLQQLGAQPVLADLEADFQQALEGCDAVVFTAGSGGKTGPDKTFTVDLWGAIRTIRACRDLDVRRFIMVSARNAGNPDGGPVQRRPYLIAKHLADEELRRSGLDFTILRPGKLTDDPADGGFRCSRPEPEQQVISREDVADAIRYCLQHPDTIGLVTQLYHGDQPIAAALHDAAGE